MHPTLFTIKAWPLIILLAVAALLFKGLAFRLSRTGGDPRRMASLNSLATTASLLTLSSLVYFIILRYNSGISISAEGAALITALLSGVWLAGKRGRQEGLPERDVALLAGIVVIAGLFGARLFYFLFEHPPENILKLFRIRGGLLLPGGIITAALATMVYARKRHLPPGRIFDAFTPALSLGIAIGALGCLIGGDSADGWAAQLYTSATGFLLFFLLTFFYKKKTFDGEVFLWFSAAAAATQLLLETLRIHAAPAPALGTGSFSPTLSLVIFPAALLTITLKRWRAHRNG